jgi:hypothetical protein
VEDGSSTSSLSAPTLSELNIGARYSAAGQAGIAVSEFAIFDSVLTAEEVAALYQRNAPLVDVGAQNTPGVYILDGRFKVASGLSGNRIEIDADEIAAYNSGGTKTFYVQASNGKALAGAGAVWLDDEGLTFEEGQDTQNYIKWVDAAGDVLGQMTTYDLSGSSDTYVQVDVKSQSSSYIPRFRTTVYVTGTAYDASMEFNGVLTGGYNWVLSADGTSYLQSGKAGSGDPFFRLLNDMYQGFAERTTDPSNTSRVQLYAKSDALYVQDTTGSAARIMEAGDDHGDLGGLTDDDHTQYLLASGSRAMSGNLDLGGNDIDNLDVLALNSVGASHPSAPTSGVILYHGVISSVNGVWIQWGDGHKELIASN